MIELTKKQEMLKKRRKLFSKCTFLFNREVPIYSLQYLVMSFGGFFYTLDEVDQNPELKYSHHVVDRPVKTKSSSIEMIQPQYIVDCLNNLFLLPTQQYAPGAALPAHLSPFVDNQKMGYVPNRQKEISHMKGEEIQASESENEEEEKKPPTAKQTKENKKEASSKSKGDADSSSEESDDNEESESEEEINVEAIQAERKAANAQLKADLQKEQKELAKVLMTNKQRKLYQKAEDEQKQKTEQAKKLRAKRKIIEKKK